MAGSEGWPFVLFSVVFYLFVGFVLASGGSLYLENNIYGSNYTAGNYTAETYINPTTVNYVSYIWQNPFSAIGWLAWLSLAFLITDIYIIVSSLIP